MLKVYIVSAIIWAVLNFIFYTDGEEVGRTIRKYLLALIPLLNTYLVLVIVFIVISKSIKRRKR